MRSSSVHVDGAAVEVDVADLGEDDLRVALVAKDVAERRCDVPLRQDARRDLVEQRLEEVVRLPVDHRHVDRRPAQRLRGGEAAEAAADDHDPMASGHRLRPRLRRAASPAGGSSRAGRCSSRAAAGRRSSSPRPRARRSSLLHGGGELERHDLSCRFEVADDVQDPVADVVDAGRREPHLRMLGDVEEVRRAQMPVAGRVARCRGCRRRSSARSSCPSGPTSYEPSNRSKRP